MDELPPLDPGWPLVTPRGALALRVAIAITRLRWTDEQCAATLGISVGRVRGLRSHAALILRRINAGESRVRRCRVCGKPLAVDSRRDAVYCLAPSSCRARAFRSGVRIRRPKSRNARRRRR